MRYHPRERRRRFQVQLSKNRKLALSKSRSILIKSMKLFLTFTLGLASLAGAFDIPKGTHNLAQIEDVQKKAARAKQPIAFIIAEKEMAAT